MSSLHGASLAGYSDTRGNVTNALLHMRGDKPGFGRAPLPAEEAPLSPGDVVSFKHPAGVQQGTVLQRLTSAGKSGSADGLPYPKQAVYVVEPHDLPVASVELTRSALTLVEAGGSGGEAAAAVGVGEEESRKRLARRAAAKGEETGGPRKKKTHPQIPLPPDVQETDEAFIPESEWAREDYPKSAAAALRSLDVPPDSAEIPRLIAAGAIKLGWPADPQAEEEGLWGKPQQPAPKPEAGAAGGGTEVGGHEGAGTLGGAARGAGKAPAAAGAVAPAGGGAGSGGGVADVPGARKSRQEGKGKQRRAAVQTTGEGPAVQERL